MLENEMNLRKMAEEEVRNLKSQSGNYTLGEVRSLTFFFHLFFKNSKALDNDGHEVTWGFREVEMQRF